MVVFGERLVLSPHFVRLEKNHTTPIGAYLSLCREYGTENSFLLESASGPEKTARYSFIGLNPFIVLKTRGSNVEIECRPEYEEHVHENLKEAVKDGELREGKDPLEPLKALVSSIRAITPPILPRFSGGAVGYVSYDAVRFFETLPRNLPDDLGVPETYFVFPEDVVCFDSLSNDILVFSSKKELPEIVKKKADFGNGFRVGKPVSNVASKKFESGVEKAKEYILSGDIFQVVLSQRFESEFEGNPLSVYMNLREINPSPYMYFLNFRDVQIAGSSPETLVRVENSQVNIRPIAGTRPRGKSKETDRKLEREMLTDEKERAEHVMLVDLGRNDIGRVCRPGSVKVDEFMIAEKYSHVQHIVSNVNGLLSEGNDAFDLLRACFPAGTVSGAPKVRAMEIIEELEPVRRGPYAGVVGYFDYSGNMDTAITIRSIVFANKKAYAQAGAGIVHDSVPKKEHAETVNKCKAMFSALQTKRGKK